MVFIQFGGCSKLCFDPEVVKSLEFDLSVDVNYWSATARSSSGYWITNSPHLRPLDLDFRHFAHTQTTE
jgi:hypothetical protein